MLCRLAIGSLTLLVDDSVLSRDVFKKSVSACFKSPFKASIFKIGQTFVRKHEQIFFHDATICLMLELIGNANVVLLLLVLLQRISVLSGKHIRFSCPRKSFDAVLTQQSFASYGASGGHAANIRDGGHDCRLEHPRLVRQRLKRKAQR